MISVFKAFVKECVGSYQGVLGGSIHSHISSVNISQVLLYNDKLHF